MKIVKKETSLINPQMAQINADGEGQADRTGRRGAPWAGVRAAPSLAKRSTVAEALVTRASDLTDNLRPSAGNLRIGSPILIGFEALLRYGERMKEYFDLASGLLTPVIAVVATMIAIFQYRLERQRWRLALFDKRYPVFEHTMKFVAAVVSHGTAKDDALATFLRDTKNGELLFGHEVSASLFEGCRFTDTRRYYGTSSGWR